MLARMASVTSRNRLLQQQVISQSVTSAQTSLLERSRASANERPGEVSHSPAIASCQGQQDIEKHQQC